MPSERLKSIPDSDSPEWWLNDQWTDEHYTLAKQHMKKIHVLPPDWDEDVISRVKLRYAVKFKTWDGRNFKGWFYTLLLNEAKDLRKSELGRKPAERTFLSIEAVEHRLTNESTGEHSGEWKDLLLRALKGDASISLDDLKMVAAHCLECSECRALYYQSASVTIDINPVLTTARVAIGDFAWSPTAPTTPEIIAKILALIDEAARQQNSRSQLAIQYYLVRKLLEIFAKQLRRGGPKKTDGTGQSEAA